jgi:polysaccharide export outer membrane protein
MKVSIKMISYISVKLQDVDRVLRPIITRACTLTAIAAALTGCATSNTSWLPTSGPDAGQVRGATDSERLPAIRIVDIDSNVARRLLVKRKLSLFSETFMPTGQVSYKIGAGDIVEVSVWEAPPAMLFGGIALDPRAGPATTRVTTFPEQMVNSDSEINVPFAGQIQVAGRTPNEIEVEIVKRLKGKANQPQVLVRTIRNNTSNVTVVGEVVNSTRMPLTGRGERLLDALAAAGGVRQPINKMTLQITRGSRVQALPLETIIRDPGQNIVLQPGDVITSLFQPLSFTALGATGKNEEVNFEAHGITLAQALARVGGLQDARADARGVFVFRFESPEVLDLAGDGEQPTPDGKIPVIYRADLKDPATFFVAQNFPIHNKDVLYVSNAPAAELQKFLNIVGSVIYPVISVQNTTR